jgi:hypothetical protein
MRAKKVNEAIKHLKPRSQEELSKAEAAEIKRWIEDRDVVDNLKEHFADLFEAKWFGDPNYRTREQDFRENYYDSREEITQHLLNHINKNAMVNAIENVIKEFKEYLDAPEDPNKYGNE